MSTTDPADDIAPVRIVNPDGGSGIVLVCEHASAHIPAALNHLGLPPDLRLAHIAWDPGALAVAERLAACLDAPLVAATLSRLIYDCNRPPDAPGAMPERSEVHDIPGNTGLSPGDRAARTQSIYDPFHACVSTVMATAKTPVLITIHSFTPTYHGQARRVEIGLLHDTDSRLADAMMSTATSHTALRVERNAPYGPQDGVTHTLQRHALPGDHPNVMIEIRNDLIATGAQQREMADMLAPWIASACTDLADAGVIRCRA